MIRNALLAALAGLAGCAGPPQPMPQVDGLMIERAVRLAQAKADDRGAARSAEPVR